MTGTIRAHGLTRYKRGPAQDGTEGKGCRCGVCEQASSTYDSHRARQIAYKRWEPYVPADRARAHARWLISRGMGWQRVARTAGVSTGSMSQLLHGSRSRPPTRRIRPSTEAAILAVRPPAVRGYSGTRGDATGTIRRLQGLTWNGWPLAELSARLGRYDAGRILRQETVTPATAAAVKALAGKLETRTPPGETMFARRAASAARNRARREGWVPLAAWDEEPGPHCIDDPAAVPAEGWERGGKREWGTLAAEVADLTGMGLDQREAAERLGVSVSTLTTTLARARKGEAA